MSCLAVVQKPQVDLSTFTGASKEWNGDGNPVIPNKRTCTPEPKRNNWVETIYPFSTSFHIFKRCFQVSSLRWTFYLCLQASGAGSRHDLGDRTLAMLDATCKLAYLTIMPGNFWHLEAMAILVLSLNTFEHLPQPMAGEHPYHPSPPGQRGLNRYWGGW